MYVPPSADDSQGIRPEEPAMNRYESVPTTWDDSCDDAFFRITLHLFSARFVEAATTLLVTNDSECAPTL
jgi:hypothetical protein